MSRPGPKKAALLEGLALEVRRMSAQSVLLSDAVAERVHVSSADLECLDYIVMAGDEAMTPGQLVAATGLTSGAITGLVDRLERSGLVRRDDDPADRRKVRVVAVPERVREIDVYYRRLAQRTEALWAQFTEDELEIVLGFIRRSLAIAAEEIAAIRAMPAAPAHGARSRGPAPKRAKAR